MSSNSTVSSTVRSNGKRRLLSPSQKYEVFVSALCGKATQREAAQRWKVDRSTVTVASEAAVCR